MVNRTHTTGKRGSHQSDHATAANAATNGDGNLAVHDDLALSIPTELWHFLRDLPLFAAASDQFVQELSHGIHVRQFQAGDFVLREGEVGRAMFFIIKGDVSVTTKDGETSYASLNTGNFFGEIGLLLQKPRTASIVCRTRASMAVITIRDFEAISASYPDIAAEVRRAAESRYQELQGKLGSVSGMSPRSSIDMSDSPPGSMRRSSRLSMDIINESGSRRSSSLSDARNRLSGIGDIIGGLVIRQNSEGAFEDVISPELGPSPHASNKSMSSTEEQEEENDVVDESPVSFKPNAVRNKTLSALVDTKRRRASVAVWADSRLSEISNAIVNGRHSGKDRQSRMQSIEQTSTEILETEDGEPMRDSEPSQTKAIKTPLLEQVCIVAILSHLSFRDCWRLRQTCRLWDSCLKKSYQLLRKVDLSGCNKRIDDASLTHIVRYCGPSGLEVLLVKNCWRITNLGIQEVARHAAHLKVLDVSGCWEIGDDGIKALSLGCRSLRSVDLSNCRKISDVSMHSLAENCANLNDVYVSYCKSLSDAAMSYIAQGCANIRRINLQRCIGITDSGFGLFATSQHFKMTELILSDCSFLTDATVMQLSKCCPNLRVLNLSFCCALTEEAFQFLSKGAPRLKILDASFCGSAVSDDSLHTIALGLPYLERLSIRGCVRVTDVGLLYLIRHATELHQINISNCKQVSDAVIRTFPAHWKSLNAQAHVIEPISIDGCENLGSTHIRRFTSP